MKIKFFANYVYIIGAFMLLAMYSCQTEPLSSEQELLTADGSAEKNPKNKKPETPQLLECGQGFENGRVNLYAGQTKLVGYASVEVVDGMYQITYQITEEGYCLTTTHISVVQHPNDFPMTPDGNPKNGHFEFGGSVDCEQMAYYEVPTSKGTHMALHGVVNCIEDVNNDNYAALNLPETVEVCINAKGVPDSYFDITISPDNSLTGTHDAWCADQDESLEVADGCLMADVYSSYQTLPDNGDGTPFEKPEGFGAVNWLMNQGFIGAESNNDNALGNYTFGDIQRAIWYLIDDSQCSQCLFLGQYNDDRALELVAKTVGHEDFVPECGEDIVIILIPHDGENDRKYQSIFITVPVPCIDGCEDTIWGAANGEGCEFPGNNWAHYFQYSNGGE